MLPPVPMKYFVALIGLTTSTFVFNTSEFMPIALLTDIAQSFGMSEAATGIMISVYAWMVALLSLPLMLLASRLELKRLLLITMGTFAVGQFLASIAVNFPMLMGARIVVACAHSIFWSIVAPIGTKLVVRAHRPLALSMVASGSSIAMILGLPIGRVIGLYVGWRTTFLMIAIVATLLSLYLAFVLPKLGPSASLSAKELPSLVKQPPVFTAYIITLLFAMGYFTVYSYIEPFLLKVAHFSPDTITWTLIFYGFCGLIGSYLFSKLYGPHRKFTLVSSLAAMILSLIGWQAGAVSGLAAVLFACVLMGTAATLFNVGLQAEFMRLVPAGATTIIISIFSGTFNLGIGSGSWLGGRITGAGLLPYIGYAGGFLVILAMVLLLFVYFPYALHKKS